MKRGDLHPFAWDFDFGNTRTTPNARFDYIKPVVENEKVLDLGVVQHDPDAKEREMWLHDLICSYASETKGIDNDEEGVQKLTEEGYDVDVANVESFELNDEYDVVVAGEIIEHLSNVGMFLDSVRHHLKTGGYFIITTPNPFNWLRLVEILIRGEKPVNSEHTCWFDSVTLRQVLKRHGFKIAKMHFTSQEWIHRNMPIPRKEIRNTGIVAISTKF